jgi:Zn-dependent protease with chaperone function
VVLIRKKGEGSVMGTDIIPYDMYHPHLGYTLLITCLAWACVGLYGRHCIPQRPRQRSRLYALAIVLPIYAEVVSYLIYVLRPAPETPVGYTLTHFHALVLQRLPIDTFLEPSTEEIALIVLALIALVSLLRFGYGTLRLALVLRNAPSLEQSAYAQLADIFGETATQFGRPAPAVRVIRQKAPLAFTTGLIRPRIYISSELLDLLSPDEAIAVLCHEWAHVLRRDTLWNWTVRLLRDVLFFLPGNHLFWRAMIASQDEACDALAAQITQQPLVLARALVKVSAAWHTHAVILPLRIVSPLALAYATPRARVEHMIRISDAAQPTDRAPGAYILAAVLLLLAVLPALLGS